MAGDSNASRDFRTALAAVAAVTLARVVVLALSPLNLHPDEAQYWWWAQSLSFGYFSKPPLIAFVVWATTALFGNAEWAVRLAAPLFHGATALLLFGVARRAWPDRPCIALWTTLTYLTLPGVSYSSSLISTDVPLLFFWALALYAFFRAMATESWRWAILCGVSVGLGLLAKYAMLYFVLGAVVAAILTPSARRLLLGTKGVAIMLIAAAIFLPNVLWNAAHGFPTVAHTEANANWGHAHYSVAAFLGFALGQFGVFSPLLMAGLLLAFWRTRTQSETSLQLVAFSLPPLVLILVQAFISQANANWAATAYIAGTPLAVEVIERSAGRWALWTTLAFDGLVMALLWIILVAPPVADRIGIGNAFKRQEGWALLGSEVVKDASAGRYDAVATENRSVVAELLYYARPFDPLIRFWDKNSRDTNHFDMTMRLAPGTQHVLLVIEPDSSAGVLPTFDSSRLIGTVSTPIGGHRIRVLRLYDAKNYLGPHNVR